MRRIAFIGGGSAKFVRGTVLHLLAAEELRDSRVVLMDIDARRLDRAAQVVRRMAAEARAPLSVEPTADLGAALDGADYVIVTVMVGGMKHYASDTAIPAGGGVLPAVGDTGGPGGVMRLLRTAPLLRRMAGLLRERAPRAWVLNFANPMSMLTQTLIECGHGRTVGLCHSIASGFHPVADFLGVPRDEVAFVAAGLNHMAYYLTLTHRGRDLYPDIRSRAEAIAEQAEHWEAETWRRERRGVERVRMELVRRLGYLTVEPHAQGDFHPWFRKDEASIRHYGPPPGWALDFDRRLGAHAEREIDEILAGRAPALGAQGGEDAVTIIRAIETGRPCTTYANVRNDGGIGNLPPWAVVDVPCRVDAGGVHPLPVGDLPAQLAAVMAPHVFAYRLAVDGVMGRDRAKVRQAIQADPLTGAVLTLPRIAALVDELLEENRAFMDGWPEA
jgi:alpha-galactosidase